MPELKQATLSASSEALYRRVERILPTVDQARPLCWRRTKPNYQGLGLCPVTRGFGLPRHL